MAFNFSDSLPAAPAGTTNVKWQTDGGGDISAYVPSAPVLASVNLTAQTAAIAATTLFTPTATGFYQLSFYLKITTPDGASSTLGAVTITYTDGVDSVAQSLVVALATQAGASATTNTLNTTAAKLQGVATIYAKTAVAVQYAIAYASGTPATMAYEVSIRAVSL